MKHLTITFFAIFLLSGCSLLGSNTKGVPTTTYSPIIQTTANPNWPQANWQLTIMQTTASRTVGGSKINVRPTPEELQTYQGARWSQPVTDLVENSLLHTLEDSGKIAAVAKPSTGIQSDYKLFMDIRRFESNYNGHPIPSAYIEINAKLIRSLDQHIVASHTFTQNQQATAKDIPTVVNAFQQALQNITTDIAGWTLTQGQTDALKP